MTGSDHSYLTIRRGGSHEIEVKRSRFLCQLARVADEAEARAFIDQVRRRHWDARHHCTAYVVGHPQPQERSNDDGEPAGTAGAPMLEVLRRRELRDTVAVVTRYFGGVLLGAGGLVRAYGGAVTGALDQVGVVLRRQVSVLAVAVDHRHAGALENGLRSTGVSVRDVTYQADGVRIEVAVSAGEVAGFHEWLATATGGAATTTPVGEAYIDAEP
ncbi:MAG: YigZ family protein [Actinocatenispora sp.]